MTDTVDIAALAKLARLEMDEKELAKLKKEIPAILALVDTIQKVHVGSGAKAPVLRNVMRADNPLGGGPTESGAYTEVLLSASPSREGDRVAVKQVISRRKAA